MLAAPLSRHRQAQNRTRQTHVPLRYIAALDGAPARGPRTNRTRLFF